MKKIFFTCRWSFIFLFFSCISHEKLMVIGHRGAAGHEVENTIPSIDKAISFGVDAVEVHHASAACVLELQERLDVALEPGVRSAVENGAAAVAHLHGDGQRTLAIRIGVVYKSLALDEQREHLGGVAARTEDRHQSDRWRAGGPC